CFSRMLSMWRATVASPLAKPSHRVEFDQTITLWQERRRFEAVERRRRPAPGGGMDRILFRNCALFDGVGDERRPNVDVLVAGETIEDVSDKPLSVSGAIE